MSHLVNIPGVKMSNLQHKKAVADYSMELRQSSVKQMQVKVGVSKAKLLNPL